MSRCRPIDHFARTLQPIADALKKEGETDEFERQGFRAEGANVGPAAHDHNKPQSERNKEVQGGQGEKSRS